MTWRKLGLAQVGPDLPPLIEPWQNIRKSTSTVSKANFQAWELLHDAAPGQGSCRQSCFAGHSNGIHEVMPGGPLGPECFPGMNEHRDFPLFCHLKKIVKRWFIQILAIDIGSDFNPFQS